MQEKKVCWMELLSVSDFFVNTTRKIRAVAGVIKGCIAQILNNVYLQYLNFRSKNESSTKNLAKFRKDKSKLFLERIEDEQKKMPKGNL